MKLLLKQNLKIMSVVVVLMLMFASVPVVPVYGEDADVDINEINFPDEGFRDYVKSFDTNNNDKLEEAEINAVTKIDIHGKNISNLKGIEYFKKLEKLNCCENALTSLDVSKNTKLERLNCTENQLTSLDVLKNTELKMLYCDENKLTSLDVSQNNNLEDLQFCENKLTSLDVSNNPKLRILICGENQLTSLDVSNNPELRNLGCDENKLTSLDVSKNIELRDLGCDENQLTSLDVSKNIKLENLWCNTNKLTSLDVSKNNNLEDLQFHKNQLTSLDVSNNPKLRILICGENQLTSLNLSNNPKLEGLHCTKNQLTSLDLSNNKSITIAKLGEQKYEVIENEVKFSDLPTGFDSAKVSDIRGGTIVDDSFKMEIDSLTYKYYTEHTIEGNEQYLEIKLQKVDGYSITVSNDGNGSGTANPAKAVKGREVVLTTTANPGYTFKEWQVVSPSDLVIKDNKFTMPEENVKVKAIFKEASVVTVEDANLKKVKEESVKALDELLNTQTFSGEELKKVEEIVKDFKEKLEKAKNSGEVKKLQEEVFAKINALWSDEELTLKAKVEAMGKKELILKAELITTKKGKKVVKIGWKKVSDLDFDGYEIYKSKNKTKFGKKPLITIKGNKLSCLNKKNLKKGKIYYYRMKAFKVINGETVYTGWSNKTWKKFKK